MKFSYKNAVNVVLLASYLDSVPKYLTLFDNSSSSFLSIASIDNSADSINCFICEYLADVSAFVFIRLLRSTDKVPTVKFEIDALSFTILVDVKFVIVASIALADIMVALCTDSSSTLIDDEDIAVAINVLDTLIDSTLIVVIVASVDDNEYADNVFTLALSDEIDGDVISLAVNVDNTLM